MGTDRQTNFAAGELAPALHGRTDIEVYRAGAARLRNFIVTPHGSLVNRPGTQHIATVAGGLGLSAPQLPVRIVPFVYAEDDAGLMLFRHKKLQVLTGFGRFPNEHDVSIVISTPYDGAHLGTLRFAQVGNAVKNVSELYPPQELRRLSADSRNWSLTEMDFDVEPFVAGENIIFDPDVVFGTPGDIISPGVTWRDAVDTDPLSLQPFVFDAPVNADSVLDPRAPVSGAGLLGDGSHPPLEWQWAVTRIVRDQNTGKTFETAPYVLERYLSSRTKAQVSVGNEEAAPGFTTLPSAVAVYPDWRMLIALQARDGTVVPDNDDQLIVASRVYRGRDGRFGFLGETTESVFVDAGAVPDFASPPPQEFNPFEFFDEDGELLRVEFPSVCEFYENRFLLAATSERPSSVWGSAFGDYENFDEVIPADAADSYVFDVASRKNEIIRAILARERLFVLTNSTIWAVAGSGVGETITPNGGIAARPFSRKGCSGDVPLVEAGDAAFFVNAKSTTVHAILFGDERPRVIDASLFASHLFNGYTIVDWAYAEDPYSVLWVARSDGALLSLTFVPEIQVLAWSVHHVEGDGLVESVAVLPEEHEDGVYLIVKRGTQRHLERLAYRILPHRTIVTTDEDTEEEVTTVVPDVRYAVFLDRAVTYDGKQTTTGDAYSFKVTDPSSTGGQIGDELRVTFTDGPAEALLTTKDGLVIQLDDEAGGPPFRLQLGARNVSNYYPATVIERDFDTALLGVLVAGNEWYVCATGVTGLGHLSGGTVTLVVDGSVREGVAVVGGTAALNENEYGAVIHAGLPYDSEVETLDATSERDRGREKIVSHITIEVEQSVGGEVGQKLDHNMAELPSRATDDDYVTLPLKKVTEKIPVSGEWNKGGRAAFRQSSPMPCTVLGFSREYILGG